MIRKPISLFYSWNLTIGTIVIIVLLYSWMSYQQKQFNPKNTTIPDLSQFVEGIETLIKPDAVGDIWILEDLKATYIRHIFGMICGILMGIVIGLLMGCFDSFEAIFKLPVTFLGRIPPTAMIAVYFILFGTGLGMFVAMIAFGIFPSLATTVYNAARKDVSDDAIYKAYTLGATNAEVIVEVVFRQILPRFIEAVRMSVGPALVFLIAAEWMMSDIGFGYRLRIQSRLLNMNIVYIYLVILCLTSYLMDWSLLMIRRKLCPWFGE